MGMFDSIYFNCPDCGKNIEAQSKSGECSLDSYAHDSVPVDVAMDANRHAPYKCSCGASWELGNIPDEETRVALTIEKVEQ